MSILLWMNDQLLKMKWLDYIVGRLLEDIFGLEHATRIGESVHYFIYDSIKILLLLSLLIFLISYIQSFFPPERTKKILGRFRGLPANLLGALLGTVTPFCSCSSIPLFIGFTSAGLPIGVTFSFLISSPLVDLASVLLLASVFNWKIAAAYVAVGVGLAVIGGSLISLFKMERFVEPFVMKSRMADLPQEELTRKDRVEFSVKQVRDIVKKVWVYVLAGVAIGAAIHNWIPQDIITAILGQDKWYSVPLATLAGAPMYADIFGTLPIAEALVTKGVGLGTALSFMMAVTALSLPSMVMLKKVVKVQLLATFFLIVTIGIMIIGYAFNAFGGLFL